MSTNRPFFANFLAAFRAQPATYKPARPPSPGPTTTTLSSSHVGTAGPVSSSARGLTAKSRSSSSWMNGSTTSTSPPQSSPTPTAPSATQSSSSSSNPPNYNQSLSPTNPTSGHASQHISSQTTNANSHSSTPVTSSSPVPVPSARPQNRNRRGSDSSSGSGGFRNAVGSDRWYVGGQTASGEERFYPLGVVTKRGGRLSPGGRVGSLDQLSL